MEQDHLHLSHGVLLHKSRNEWAGGGGGQSHVILGIAVGTTAMFPLTVKQILRKFLESYKREKSVFG